MINERVWAWGGPAAGVALRRALFVYLRSMRVNIRSHCFHHSDYIYALSYTRLWAAAVALIVSLPLPAT